MINITCIENSLKHIKNRIKSALIMTEDSTLIRNSLTETFRQLQEIIDMIEEDNEPTTEIEFENKIDKSIDRMRQIELGMRK